MFKKFFVMTLCMLAAGCLASAAGTAATTIQDVTELEAYENTVSGIGLVVGLNDTGDDEKFYPTKERLANYISSFDQRVLPQDLKKSQSSAIVNVRAILPPFHNIGGKIRVTISTLGNAESLQGGTLLYTPLTGPGDDTVYALAEGRLTIPDVEYPTSAVIENGATITNALESDLVKGGKITLTIHSTMASATLAKEIQDTINESLNPLAGTVADVKFVKYAYAESPGKVTVTLPEEVNSNGEYMDFLSRIQKLVLKSNPAELQAKIIIDSKTYNITTTKEIEVTAQIVKTGDYMFVPDEDVQTVMLKDILRGLGIMGATKADIVNAVRDLARSGAIPAKLVEE